MSAKPSSGEGTKKTRVAVGLERLAGRWTDEQHQEFVAAVEHFSVIDQEVWDSDAS